MAVIKPFKAIRPSKEEASVIAALPYDVYNRIEAKEQTIKCPGSFLEIDRAETQFEDSVDTYADCVYKKAHDLLWDWVKAGRFIRDDLPCYYIYELIMDGRHQTGIVACASIDDYENGIIKKHENTRAEKEADRIRHVDSCNAQTGPIFLAYRKNSTIKSIISRVKEGKPLYDFTSEDGITHRCWIIGAGDDIAAIEDAFDKTDSIYIADGHHRAASAVKVGLKRRAAHPGHDGSEEFNYFLSVLFPDEELKIMDYNRVVKDLNGLDGATLMSKISEVADLVPADGNVAPTAGSSEPISPKAKGQFAMFLDGKWYLYSFKDSVRSDDPVAGLDVSILQDRVLAPVLGIGDPKTDDRIDFVGGIRGLKELERRCSTDCKVAFAMYPTSIAELFAVADAGLLMPPKSTWFEPKLRSGLFIHEL